MDSTSFAPLDLDPAATFSATHPFFNGLLSGGFTILRGGTWFFLTADWRA